MRSGRRCRPFAGSHSSREEYSELSEYLRWISAISNVRFEFIGSPPQQEEGVAEGRGGVVNFLFPAARSGLNSAPAQDSRRRLCSRIGSRESPVLWFASLSPDVLRALLRQVRELGLRNFFPSRLEFFRALQSIGLCRSYVSTKLSTVSPGSFGIVNESATFHAASGCG